MKNFFKLIFSVGYFLALFYVVFLARRRNLIDEPSVNWIPFKNIVTEYRLMNVNIYKDVYEFVTNVFGNILMFVPFSMILVFVCKIYDVKKILLAAFLTSLTIEVLQYVFVIGVSDMDDLILNVTGAYLGILICRALIKMDTSY